MSDMKCPFCYKKAVSSKENDGSTRLRIGCLCGTYLIPSTFFVALSSPNYLSEKKNDKVVDIIKKSCNEEPVVLSRKLIDEL